MTGRGAGPGVLIQGVENDRSVESKVTDLWGVKLQICGE